MSGSSRTVTSPKERLTVESATELKSHLLEAFEESESISFSMTEVEEIDLAAIVVLYAAAREAESTGKAFHLSGDVRPAVARAFQLGGFCHEASLDAEELESRLLDFHGEN